MASDQLQVVIRQRVEARQDAVIQDGRQVGELGALFGSEEFASGHGEARYGMGACQQSGPGITYSSQQIAYLPR
jgi:hypothetical protein